MILFGTLYKSDHILDMHCCRGHKPCRLGRGEVGQKSLIFLSKKTTKRGQKLSILRRHSLWMAHNPKSQCTKAFHSNKHALTHTWRKLNQLGLILWRAIYLWWIDNKSFQRLMRAYPWTTALDRRVLRSHCLLWPSFGYFTTMI